MAMAREKSLESSMTMQSLKIVCLHSTILSSNNMENIDYCVCLMLYDHHHHHQYETSTLQRCFFFCCLVQPNHTAGDTLMCQCHHDDHLQHWWCF